MLSIGKYIWDASDEERRDYEDHIFDNVFSCFLVSLPQNPPEPIAVDLWSDGSQIMCRTEALADQIANALETISGEHEAHTGYYDPFEDARSGETDNHTGWWYVDFD